MAGARVAAVASRVFFYSRFGFWVADALGRVGGATSRRRRRKLTRVVLHGLGMHREKHNKKT